MLEPSHPLAPLQARAALASGWPVLWLDAPNEAAAEGALLIVEQQVGPCPQAELHEAWDEGEPWTLRIEVPGLLERTWEDLHAALPDAVLAVGQLPGAREARDTQAVVDEVIPAALPAVAVVDAVGGGLCSLDLATEAPEPSGAAVASELVAAVHAVDPSLVRHPAESVAFVRHRPTGRRGWRLLVPDDVLQGMDGDALLALRRDIVDAVAGVVLRRQDSDVPLAPDLSWDPRFGFSVVVWRVGENGPALPGDSVVEPGLSPPLDVLRALQLRLHHRVQHFELQVVPADPARHDELALALADRATPGMEGGISRWLPARMDGRVVPALALTWRVDPSDLVDAEPWLQAARDHEGVLAVRVVPGVPVGLEDAGPYLDPAWRLTPHGWIVRWRDGVRERDRSIACVPRDADAIDSLIVQSVERALRSVPGGVAPPGSGPPVRTVRDDTERKGVQLRLAPSLLEHPTLLGWALDALGREDLPEVSAVIDLALPETGPEILLWRIRPEAAAPTWVSIG